MPRGVTHSPRYHVTATIPFAGWDGGMRVVLTDQGPLDALQAYLLSLGMPSLTTQRAICAAVGRLYDYYRAAPPVDDVDRAQFMSRFAQAVLRGTVVDGDDPLDLFWGPTTRKKARHVLRVVTEFGDFCAKAAGTAPLNPVRDATFAERVVALRAAAHRRKYDLLAHLGTPGEVRRRAQEARAVTLPATSRYARRDPPFFPFARTHDLLLQGFARGPERGGAGAFWERHNLRDMMIAVLQRFGGVRASEALHLWVSDVTPVLVDGANPQAGSTAHVRLFHPADGVTRYRDPLTGALRTGTRAEALQTVYGRLPRHDPRTPPGDRLGWKSMLIEHPKLECSDVHWFPEEWGSYFLALYDLYVRHVHPGGAEHPYLFVVTKPGDSYGRPLRLESYYDSLARAVERIGLESQKELGTTSHGLRHAYAQVLRHLKVSRKIIQVFLHHASPLSQDAYTAPSRADTAAEIGAARQRLLAAAIPALPAATTLLPPTP